jgi:hypothetical protein
MGQPQQPVAFPPGENTFTYVTPEVAARFPGPTPPPNGYVPSAGGLDRVSDHVNTRFPEKKTS